MSPGSAAVSGLNMLLRVASEAVAGCEEALRWLPAGLGSDEVQSLRDDHHDAVETLCRYIQGYGGEPEDCTLQAPPVLARGPGAVLAGLMDRERSELAAYEEALGDNNVPALCKTYLRFTLLPQTRTHLLILNRLLRWLEHRE